MTAIQPHPNEGGRALTSYNARNGRCQVMNKSVLCGQYPSRPSGYTLSALPSPIRLAMNAWVSYQFLSNVAAMSQRTSDLIVRVCEILIGAVE